MTIKDPMESLLSHPYTKSLLDSGKYELSRPYEDVPEHHKEYSLTTGTLIGDNLISPTPICLSLKEELVDQSGESELFVLYHLGPKLCGHKGIIHGGLLATLLDEALCRCGFAVLPRHVGVTASLSTQYLAPTPADSFVVLHGKTTKVDGRKVWVEGSTNVLPKAEEYSMDQELVKTVKAELLAIEPKWASKLTERGKAGRPVEQVEQAQA